MKPVNEMSLSEAIEHAQHLILWDERGDSVDSVKEVLLHIEELTRWIPVEERLPTQADADEHGYVQWWDENEVALPCSHYWDFTGKPTYKFTHWRRIDTPEGV